MSRANQSAPSSWTDQPSSSTPGPPSSGGPGPGHGPAEGKLTPQEVEALRAVKRSVDRYKTAGWFLGGGASFLFLHRRKPRPSNLQIATLSFVAGLGCSFLMIPLGIINSKDAIFKVDDPNHLKRVLSGAMEDHRRGKTPAIGVSPPKGLDGEQDWASNQSRLAGSNSNGFSSAGANDSSFAGMSDSYGSSSPASSPRAFSSSGSGSGSAQQPDESRVNDDGSPVQASRWAQLRGERGVEPSKWEKIRQENARNAYQTQRASAPATEAGAGSMARTSTPVDINMSGGSDDPRWTSGGGGGSASGRDQMEGWGQAEFIQEPAERKSNQRRYGVLSVNEEVESSAPLRVAKGSLLAALAGALGGSAYGVVTGKSGAGLVAGSRMGFNMFAFGFPFFAVREYALRPATTVVAPEAGAGPGSLHTRDLGISGLSGALVGGGVAGYARGTRSIPSGMVVFGIACTGLQLIGNELRVIRTRMLSGGAVKTQAQAQRQLPVQAETVAALEPENQTEPKPKRSSWLSKLVEISPVRAVSDEEYEKKLTERLSDVEARISLLESELRHVEAEERDASAASA